MISMETKFNSQICTTREQSERLIALGLKKETADMCWQTITLHGQTIAYPSQDVWLDGSIITNNHFPAWSLHRLIEMALKDLLICGISFVFNEDSYDKVIKLIEFQINNGRFPKKYLV